MNILIKYYCFLCFLLCLSTSDIFSNNIFSAGQDSVMKHCPDSVICQNTAMTQFDCRSQSYSTILSQGDTLRFIFIVYTRQDFRIMACCEAALGNISYQIIEPDREIANKIKKINENEEIILKLDEYGEQVLGSDDKPVVLSREILRDTIWDKQIKINETILYDSENNKGTNYFDIINNDRTKRLMIKIKVNGSDKTVSGCVSILIGRKYSNPFKLSNKE